MNRLPTQPSPKDVAFHEAGHIFAGKLHGRTFISSEIHPEDLTGKGLTTWHEESTTTMVEGIIAAAGICAEFVLNRQPLPAVFPLSLYGAESDDEALAKKSARTQSQHPDETRTEVELVAFYLCRAYQMCKIDEYWTVIAEIAALLEKQKKVDDSEVTSIFLKHGVQAIC